MPDSSHPFGQLLSRQVTTSRPSIDTLHAEIAEVVPLSRHRVLRLLFDPALPPAEITSAVDRIKTGISDVKRHRLCDVVYRTHASKLS